MSMRLLVVDDDSAALDLVRAMVEPLGYAVLATTNSQLAAQWVNGQKFDGVFVDARMPNLDGFELTKLIRNVPSNNRVPIVMITASADVETMRHGYKAGVTFFVTKPFIPEKLRGLLNIMRSAILREQTHYVRLPFCTMVTCRRGNDQSKLRSVDISMSGMLLELSSGLKPGEEVKLDFTLLPGTEHLNLQANIVHTIPPDRIAVQFHDLHPRDQETIREYISRSLEE
jgi:CheY-like chemotaxis protein